MKIRSTIEGYQVNNQLITDTRQSFIGELIGLFIQPAQSKAAFPHYTKEQLRQQISSKCSSLLGKINGENTALINKWHFKLERYQRGLKALDTCSHDYFTVKTQEGRSLDAVHVSPPEYNDTDPTK